MKQVYESGLAQSKGVYQLYQALAIAEGHHQHLQGRSGRVRAGHGVGRPGSGRDHGRHRRRRGMARVAAIKSTPLKGFAFGGLIGGQDKGERADNVLIRATPGEYMLDRPTVRITGYRLWRRCGAGVSPGNCWSRSRRRVSLHREASARPMPSAARSETVP